MRQLRRGHVLKERKLFAKDKTRLRTRGTQRWGTLPSGPVVAAWDQERKTGDGSLAERRRSQPARSVRKWFAHDPAKWQEFQRRYRAELESNPDALKPILEAATRGDVTLLYGARDTEHNSALLLKAFLEEYL
jgi:uncharacterized protein DUF488